MKIKTILIAALAASVALLSSCNDTDKNVDGDSKSVRIKLADSQTRAEGNEVGTSAVYFGTGHLLFVSRTGQITKYMTINDNETTESNLNLTELKDDGIEVKNVADNSREVYILSNLPSTVNFPSAPVGMNIADIKKLMVTVEKISDNSGGVSAMPLYGMGAIDTGTDPATVTVTVKAIGSRIEIVKFDLKPGAEITSYQIDGIFINAYYTQMQVDGTVATTNFKDNESGDDGHNTYKGGSTEYPSTLPLWDWNASGLGNLVGNVYSPATGGKVWAYNVFPGAPAPHIVVRLSNVILDGSYPMANPQYLTVRTYNNKKIDTFVNGTVYQIEEFLFDENDLTDKPEIGVMDIEVSVNLVDWTTEKVTADL